MSKAGLVSWDPGAWAVRGQGSDYSEVFREQNRMTEALVFSRKDEFHNLHAWEAEVGGSRVPGQPELLS